MSEVVLQGVEKRLGSFRLGPIDLKIGRGERVAVVGPSGSGKSTLLRIVAGLLTPDRGKVLIDGTDVTNEKPWERGVGVVFQSPALFPSLTVFENVVEPLLARGLGRGEAEARAKEVLARLGLGGLEERYPAELSRGQQQRAALARALAVAPSVLLLDEPLTALDAPLRGEVLPYIYEAAKGRTVVYVTHDFEEAAYIAGKVVVIVGGKVAAVGGVAEVFEDPPTVEVAKFLGYYNSVEAECGELFFRPWDVELGGPLEGEVVAYWYAGGRYEAVVKHGGRTLRLRLPSPPGPRVKFRVVKGKCFKTSRA
ncbi:MAG: ABC transporter ATP-binding protein [Pyrobaculum sp.]